MRLTRSVDKERDRDGNRPGTLRGMAARTLPLALTALLGACAGRGAAIDLSERLAAVRGANYVPSWASTSVAAWTRFDGGVVDRELGFARRLGLNSVRVFLSVVAYEHDSKAFLARLDEFVALADRHGLRPMFVLFDSCFGKEPALDQADSKMWVNNPGYSRIAAADWSGLEAYVRAVVTRFSRDPRVLMWDVMNEPMADFEHVTRAERDRIWAFCRHFCRFVKALDRDHAITVGHAAVDFIPRTADLVDALSVHSYAVYEDWLQADLDLALRFGRRYGKPVLVTEFGNPGAGQTYELGLDVIERNRLGFYFWELMIGKIMFADQSGLVYPDGTIRDLGPVARLAGPVHGFERKAEGGIPLRTPPDESALRAFLARPEQWRPLLDRLEQEPRTREKVVAPLAVLGALGRRLTRPRPESQEIFELALSIPHHYRLKREEEAVKAFDRLLRLVREGLDSRRAAP